MKTCPPECVSHGKEPAQPTEAEATCVHGKLLVEKCGQCKTGRGCSHGVAHGNQCDLCNGAAPVATSYEPHVRPIVEWRAKSLWAIDQELLVLTSIAMEAEDGEIPESVAKALEDLLALAGKKTDSYLALIRTLEAHLESIAAHQAEVAKRKARTEAFKDRLRDGLATFMGNQGLKFLRPQDPSLPTAYLQKGRAKLDLRPELLPDDMVEIEQVRKPLRDLIKAAVDKGETVMGATKVVGPDYIMLR